VVPFRAFFADLSTFLLAMAAVILYGFLRKPFQIAVKPMVQKRKLVEAVGYMRTSSATNVGPDKDSEKRQRHAIAGYARSAGMVIVEWFYDAAIGGADPIETRPGFSALLARIAGNGVRAIVVETAQRFARDLMVQEVGFAMLRDLGITLVAADSPAAFLDDGPTSTLIRQILGAVAQFDKAMTVAKLKGARDRIRRTTGKCEGRRSWAEISAAAKPGEPYFGLIDAAKRLRGNSGRRRPLRAVAAELAALGFTNLRGGTLSPGAIASMVS
jgi:DNA invertase Pin-like site-specific DNA recombinase